MTQSSSGVAQPLGQSRRARFVSLALTGLGAFLGLASVGFIAQESQQPWLIGSFGATCVLLFAFPSGPFSGPRNVIGGHVLCSLVALVCLHVLGPGLLSMALAGALATVLMVVTRTVHPPAGGNPVIIFLTQQGWSFLLVPTLGGACFLVLLSWLYWKIVRTL